VRLMDDDGLLEAARKLVKKLGISGLCGLDFMLECGTNQPYLIEINGRATQTCHLPLAQPRDIPGALYSALTGEAPRQVCSPVKTNVVALFPAAWQMDPNGEVLRTGFHDVPWKEPSLVREGIAPPSKINYENWLALKSRLGVRRAGPARAEDET
jgi:predicted ATP-grasp superfamily ATP-dependent carboligase